MASVLIVDDLPAVHEMLEAVINPCGFLSAFALNGQDALKRYREGNIDVVLVDIAMEPMDGITVLKELRTIDPNAIVIMMTGYSSTDTAMQALKFGAFDYVQKPFRLEELVKTLHRAVDARKKGKGAKVAVVEEPLRTEKDVVGALAGESEAIKAVNKLVQKLLRAKTPMLIQGEVGTGKRSLADLVHQKGPGARAPFIGIDCRLADPEELRKGLANGDGTPGFLIQKAQGGTLFFNNIDKLAKDLQSLLAKVLQVSGGTFRLICATEVQFESHLERGSIADDFFFKIATLPITMPPLRNRREDLPVLVKDILKRAENPFFDTSQIELSRDAESMMYYYPWPGNLIELSNVLTSVVVVSHNRLINAQQLPLRLRDARKWPNLKTFLLAREEAYISELLRLCDNDKEKAAKLAGVADLFESESVVKAREKVEEASSQDASTGKTELSADAQEALERLKAELDSQKEAIKEAKAMFIEREEFLETSENTLFEKVMAQQERETELEQLSDDLDQREKALNEREKALETSA